MRVLIDTNVILDVWLAREPFWPDSASVLAKVEKKELDGCICPTTVTTLHYLGKKVLGEAKTRSLLKDLISICDVGAITSETFSVALDSQIQDFEDAVIEAVALDSNIDLIVTRNIKDFKKSRVQAQEPSLI